MHLKICKLNEKIVYYKNNFKKGKETLVFLHGLTGHSLVWDKYLRHFDKTHNLISIDLAGHGLSHRPRNFTKYHPNAIAEEVLDVLKAEKINTAHFVVHSYSFLVFLELLRFDKNLIKSSVVISPYLPNKKKFAWNFERAASIIAVFFTFFLPPRKKYPLGIYTIKKKHREFDFQKIIPNIFNTGIMPYFALNYYCLNYDVGETFKYINFPLLFVSGRKDGIILIRDVENISKRIAKSKLVVLEEKNHIIVYPFYHELIPIISKFLEKGLKTF